MDFEKLRNSNGTINLWDAWRSQPCADDAEEDQMNAASDFLCGIENLYPIVSRQAAAIAIQTANFWAFRS